MSHFNWRWYVVGGSILVLGGLGLLTMVSKEVQGSACVSSVQDLAGLFPKTAAEVVKNQKRAEKLIDQVVQQILAVPPSERTFENTALVYDRIVMDLDAIGGGLLALKELSPVAELRDAAQKAMIALNQVANQKLALNPEIYRAFQEYMSYGAKAETLADNQRYFLQETMAGFERAGLSLPQSQLLQVRALIDELDQISQQFAVNIASDQSKVAVSGDQLPGLPADFIESLPKGADGNYLLGCDYPTFMRVIKHCQNSDTRKKIFQAFNRRAYPENEAVLAKLIAKRDELSHLLGFASYAHLDLDSQMVQTPERALEFLRGVQQAAMAKAKVEIDALKQNLPESVTLVDGKIAPWDLPFLQTAIRLRDLNIDEQLVAEYFVLEPTLKALFKIYEQFFGLRLVKANVHGLWSDEVQAVEVYNANDNQLLGYLLLDLFPRPNKYSHAAAFMVVPAVLPVEGSPFCPAVGVVMANFPRPSNGKPALMTHYDVNTFFHEFGHALHGLLGRTELVSQSGLRVKVDFVELPSQMLEDWLKDPAILTQISAHYLTGEPLPNELAHKLVNLERFDAGYATCRQLSFGLLSLALFGPGSSKDIQAIKKSLWVELMPYLVWDEDNRFEASFGHLTDYGAKYYGYLWSKVFAKDLFAMIKAQGLLNPAAGQAYVDKILSQGGQKDPNLLLVDFLGREPSQEAFKGDLGFE